MAGMIIFPSCFAFGVEPGAGPGLIFVTLPNVFNAMSHGVIWGGLFFVFMSFAAMSTVVAVFENLVAFGIDNWKVSRGKSVIVNLILMLILAAPCALGFNVLAGWEPMGPGTVVLDLEDFIVSNTLLPLGSMIFVLFCSSRYGWGWDNFIAEVDAGQGIKFPRFLKPYFQYILPLIILVIFFQGYYELYQKMSATPAPAEAVEVIEESAVSPDGTTEVEATIVQETTADGLTETTVIIDESQAPEGDEAPASADGQPGAE